MAQGTTDLLIAIPTALIAAASYATASVMQHRAAHREPIDKMVSARLVLRLMTRGLWLLGAGAILFGLVFQSIASHFAPLTLILCLLTTTVILIVPIAAVVERRRVVRRDLFGVTLCAIGVGAFIGLTRPTGGSSQISGHQALRVGLLVLLGVSLFLLIAYRADGEQRPAFLGIAAGMMVGTVDALIKTCSDILALRPGEIFTTWPLYALAAAGGLSVILEQSALRSGRLPASLSAITVLSPVIGIAIGATTFHENLVVGWLAIPEAVAAAAAFAGIALLSSTAAQIADMSDVPIGPSMRFRSSQDF